MVKKTRTKKIKTQEQIVEAPKYKGADRINAIADHTKKLKKGFLENVYLEYSLMNTEEFAKAVKDKELTLLERQIIRSVTLAASKGKDAITAQKMIQDRIGGKAKDRIEHSGPDGGAITVSQTEKDKEFDKFIDSMSKKELAAYEKALGIISKLKKKSE